MFKVVIVDDEKKVQVMLQTMINWKQYNFSIVDAIADDTEAFEFIRDRDIDLVITDIKKKDKDGFNLINELKKTGYRGEFLILSNYNDYEYVRKGLLLGAVDYILKYELNPIDFAQTLDRIGVILHHKKRSIPMNVANKKEEGVSRYRKEVDIILSFINNNIDKKITLSMIALNVNLNESYICTIFKEQVGQSIIQYINEMKMHRAVQLIMTSDLLLKDIAEHVGIKDQFYFYRVFKKQYGISPLKYKTMNLQEVL